MKRTLIQNAVIVNEGRKVLGSVVIEGEKIAEILTGEEKTTTPCDEIIDATGCYLLPGAIDGDNYRKPCCGRRRRYLYHGYAEYESADDNVRGSG